MAVYENLIYFLENGKFENINFGITRGQLIKKIGKPDFTLHRKSKMPTLLKYDNIEFYFEDESENARLQRIQIDHPIKYSGKGSLIFHSYRWTVKLTIEQAINFLNKHKIEFEETTYPQDVDFWRLLEIKSGVQIHFTNQTDENVWYFQSLGRSIELNSKKMRTKQISCEVEAGFYEQLKRSHRKLENQLRIFVKRL